MQTKDLVLGRSYAWSPAPRDSNVPFSKVVFVGPARAGMVKVRRADGDLSGLEEWVATRSIPCRWSERVRFERDRDRQAVLDASARAELDRVVEDAISAVFVATGEETGFQRTWIVAPERARRLWLRAGLTDDPVSEPQAFLDRFASLHLSHLSALKFARAFAAAEPEPVVHYIEEAEDELRAEGFLPGRRSSHSYLRELRPGHALVRQWAGEGEVQLLRAQIERLQQIAVRSIAELRAVGKDRVANRLEKELHGR